MELENNFDKYYLWDRNPSSGKVGVDGLTLLKIIEKQEQKLD